MLVRSPSNEEEFRRYYQMRWEILRKPWRQQPGSEKDDLEKESVHVMALEDDGVLVGVARFHSVRCRIGQVRYMAVNPEHRNRGVGRALMAHIECHIQENGYEEVVLDARDEAVPFYTRMGFVPVAEGPVLFGSVRHTRMRKLYGKAQTVNERREETWSPRQRRI